METSEIVRALRCTATPPTEELDCKKCPYYIQIPLKKEDVERGLPEDFNNYCDTDKIMLDAAERLEELSKPDGGWIDTYDELPKAGNPVLVAREGGKVEQGIYLDVNGYWKVYGARTKRITHWMPMPEPPDPVDGLLR